MSDNTFALLPVPAFTVGATGKIIAVNAAYTALTGLSADDVVGKKSWAALKDKKGRTIVDEALDAGEPDSRDLDLKNANGEAVSVVVKANPSIDADGESDGAVVAICESATRDEDSEAKNAVAVVQVALQKLATGDVDAIIHEQFGGQEIQTPSQSMVAGATPDRTTPGPSRARGHRRFESLTEDPFEAFASYRVRGAILDHLRMLDPMSRKLRGASRQVSKTVSELMGRLGRAPEQEEVAGALGIELTAYHKLLTEISEAGVARLDLSELGEPSGKDSTPEAIATRHELVSNVADAVESLPERLNLIVGLYYQQECSFREIGEVLDITESRVCQLHSEAMHLIRAMVEGRPMPRGGRRALAGTGRR
ncbi:MAG: sigma-70 family RNA polymerase sigma factor [Planctomycetes bacterium]|nr:sigma-70 family RNA polymerase sigma factor [Planctomycetota bacterium]